MKTNKILLQVSCIDDIEYYKELGVSNFLFPLESYSVGYTSFTFDQIKDVDNAYILVNRILTDTDIDNFLKLDIPDNVKGFVIEDVGLMRELSGKGYTLISFQNHLNNNYMSVNYWLKFYDSLVVSTDITRDEVKKIIDNGTKPLTIYLYGYPMIMYSRRSLVSNYYKHINSDIKKNIDIKENASNIHFFMIENDYGTAVFNSTPFDHRSIVESIDEDKIMFYLINSSYSNKETIKDVILGSSVDASTGFLDKKTVYKIGDLK